MHLAWLLVLFVPVYKQLGLFMIIKRLLIMLPIINQRMLNRLIIDISINCPSPSNKRMRLLCRKMCAYYEFCAQ